MAETGRRAVADGTDPGLTIAENARRCAELSRRVAALTITEASPDGTIRVTVSASGMLTDLVLVERRQFVPMAQLSAEVMRCLHRAQARIPALMRQILAETMGTVDASAQQILADTEARFPPAPPVTRGFPPRPPAPAGPPPMSPPMPPARPRPAPGRPPAAHEDTDWGESSILESADGDR